MDYRYSSGQNDCKISPGGKAMGLENKVVVIAGATGGLGRVVTQRMAAHGMNVALLGSDADRLNALAGDLKLGEGTYSTHAVQVEDRNAVIETAGAVTAKHGRVDGLFNFVGGWVGGKDVVELPAEDLSSMLNQHLWTTFNLMQAFVPAMIANKFGRIASVSPPNSLFPVAKRGAYAAAKAAQEALLLGIAQELKGTGVTANVIVVAAIDAKHERDTAPTPKNVDWSTPEEISATLLYLLSDEAHGINGQRLVLYGG